MSDFAILAIVTTVVFLILAVFVISFMIIFQKKQIKNIEEKAFLKARYEKEILQSQIEVQNSTLKYIGQELHDNIGQLLSVTKINLGVMEENLADKNSEEFDMNFHQTYDLVAEVINEVRGLSKSLDDNFVQEFGLTESIAHELERIRKTRKFITELVIEGEKYKLGYEREIILFRIVQEALNNALKHSEAINIEVHLQYSADRFTVMIADKGKGFDYDEIMNQPMAQSGAGLRNIKQRAALINFDCELMSQKGQGTRYILMTHQVSDGQSGF